MGWLDATATYSSGDKPKFKVGDKVYKTVETPSSLRKKKLRFCVHFEIIGVSTKKKGFIFREFTYTLRSLNTGEAIENVYESELYTEWKEFKNPENPDRDPLELAEKLYEDSWR